MREPILTINDLTVDYETDDGTVHAVDSFDLSLSRGECLGLVGETGAGKTTTALSVLRLLPDPPVKFRSGTVLFQGENLYGLSDKKMREIRGNRISMIFQDPMTSLNPVMTVAEQIAEVLRFHRKMGKLEAYAAAGDALEMVGIPRGRSDDYPNQFSGGMRQRVGIAIALSCKPEVLLADEPTTALDVTIQAQVLKIMKKLRSELQTACILITHDLGIVAKNCDRVVIMYSGQNIETAPTEALFNRPAHPYTKGLFASIPRLDVKMRRLEPIGGLMADPTRLPEGCRFHPRCPHAMPQCRTVRPKTVDVAPGHSVSCHLYMPSAMKGPGETL